MKTTAFLILFIFFIGCTNDGPATLEIDNEKNFTIKQKHSKKIKGTKDDIEIQLGDIINSCVIVKITGKTFTVTNYFEGEMCQSDSTIINYHGNYYCIYISELVNHLIRTDEAKFGISKVDGTVVIAAKTVSNDVNKQVEDFLTYLEKTNFTFIRNGESYTADEAAAHLKSKYDSEKIKIKSFDQFVSQIATKSSFSGEYYQIVNENGTVRFADWINQVYIVANMP